MPHLFLQADPPARDFFKHYPSWVLRDPDEDMTLKFMGLFAAPHGEAFLFRVLVVEGRLNQHFYLQLSKRDEESVWLLGLDHHGAVIRTAGVKRMIAAVGSWVASLCEGEWAGGNLESEWQWARKMAREGAADG